MCAISLNMGSADKKMVLSLGRLGIRMSPRWKLIPSEHLILLEQDTRTRIVTLSLLPAARFDACESYKRVSCFTFNHKRVFYISLHFVNFTMYTNVISNFHLCHPSVFLIGPPDVVDGAVSSPLPKVFLL